jgi:hypothetical protein
MLSYHSTQSAAVAGSHGRFGVESAVAWPARAARERRRVVRAGEVSMVAVGLGTREKWLYPRN